MTYITVEVDVDMDNFSDEEIRDEYNERGLSGGGSLSDEHETLTKIWLHDREGRKDEAYALMREYVLDKLNKVI
jgi:FAD/FMN-containing dehydrogenase